LLGTGTVGATAFIIGFLALSLARSELFTENFLVPVAAVVAKDAPWRSAPRLWLDHGHDVDGARDRQRARQARRVGVGRVPFGAATAAR
jgi:hypothetical protein